jgi:hypothetical protein
VSVGPDRSLLVVMPDSVYRIEIDAIKKRADPEPQNDWRADPGTSMLPVDRHEESWKQTESLELSEVV